MFTRPVVGAKLWDDSYFIASSMNELLSKELKGIIQVDEQMRNHAFNRIQYLKGLKEDNRNLINQSLKNITTYMQANGNKGCYIMNEKTTDLKKK